jgi:hypothetical protein
LVLCGGSMYTQKATRIFSVVFVLALILAAAPPEAASAAFLSNLPSPPNSWAFGETVTVLPNGNFVVTDPDYPKLSSDSFAAQGAVYLYSPGGVLISTLKGNGMGNSVGSYGITVLTNGNYVVNSPFWEPSSNTDALGAVTWCSGQTGCNGFVSASNSLVGSSKADLVGYGGVTALTNGNYVVRSPSWDKGSIVDAGAVTWGNGTTGTKGVVSASNSLVGSHASDQVGSSDANVYTRLVTLKNGNYLVLDPVWDNGSAVDAGSVTWGNGTGGTVGAVSPANSLVGSSAGDSVGDDFMEGSFLELTNGSYVVVSSSWDLDATHPDVGAVTWGSGTSGVAGLISAANSLVGLSKESPVGDWNEGVTALTNGNYVVASPDWSPDGSNSAWGAVTWGSGTAGVLGQISALNSLVGSANDDSVGSGNFFGGGGVIALANGNYVVTSYAWNNQGAVTWGDGTSGITGPVSSSNSLVGEPSEVIALTNGNYAVSGSGYIAGTSGPEYLGFITWGDGTTGTRGAVSITNSMIRVNTFDDLGVGGLVALTNGNFVAVCTSASSNVHVQGVTWVNGSQVTTGGVSVANSLMGSTADDQVGGNFSGGEVKALRNGNYVVISPSWDNGSIEDAGAVTWGDGTSGTTGVVSAANSLVGSTAQDQLGSTYSDGGVLALSNGNYVVSAPQWDNGSTVDAGAVTWGDGTNGTTGVVSASNSLIGSFTNDEVGYGSFWGDPGVTPLSNGNYIVNSPQWSSAIGAVTWGNGTSGTVGEVSAANSLVNTCANDPTFCVSKITSLPDGSVSMYFQDWSNGSSHGAISLISGDGSTLGPVSTANSVLGKTACNGHFMNSDYDATRTQLIVGRPCDNIVTILGPQQLFITISGNAGDAGVVLHYSINGTAKTVTSASNGRYSFTVPYQWSGTVTPSKTGVTFKPPSITYASLAVNQTNKNYADIVSFASTASYDGWILESAKGTGKGGTMNSTNTTFQLGDDKLNRQYRAILSFNTAALPDAAVIQSAFLKIKPSGSPVGVSPFTVLGTLYAEIRKGYFGSSSALELTDFNALATAAKVGSFGKTPVSGWYGATLNATGVSDINKVSLTQLRLYFATPTNNNNQANYMLFFSGNGVAGSQPLLTITYSLP